MKGKLMLLAGAAVGYIFGTRAGRERYEQMKGKADAFWHDPKVQQKVSEAQHAVKTKAPELQEKVTGAASRATDKVKSTVSRHDDDDDADQSEVNRDGHPGYAQGRPLGS
jgi:hypothetical protein